MVPIVLIHGMWCGSWYFENWKRHLEACGRVVHSHVLPGHSSGEDVSGVSFRCFVDSVKSLLDKIGPADVIGHSMGALVAQVLCAEDSRVKSAVFVTSAPPRGIFLRKELLLRMVKWRYVYAMATGKSFLLTQTDLRALILNCVDDAETIEKKLVPESGLAARELATWCIGVDASKVKCPVLVVAASEDRMTPSSIQRAIAKKYDAQYRVFDNCGHMLMIEKNWGIPISSIIEWLNTT